MPIYTGNVSWGVELENTISESDVKLLVDQFEWRAFSTYDFIELLKVEHPEAWASYVREYGSGGRGAGRHYSAYSRVSHLLDYWSRPSRRLVDKLHFARAPKVANWGSSIIRYWAQDETRMLGPIFPEEVLPSSPLFEEGAVATVLVNRYERDPAARRACIAHHKAICAVCSFDFGKRYGTRGAGFIHVHHITPVSSKAGRRYKINPVKDLVPVCPNCHAMLHTVQDGLSVEGLRNLLR